MANTTCFRQIGPTVALAVGTTSHAPVTISVSSNDQCNYASFLNIGSASAAVNVAPVNAGPASFPIDGTPQTTIVLPPNMQFAISYATPTAPFSVTGISSTASGSTVYITPLGDQS